MDTVHMQIGVIGKRAFAQRAPSIYCQNSDILVIMSILITVIINHHCQQSYRCHNDVTNNCHHCSMIIGVAVAVLITLIIFDWSLSSAQYWSEGKIIVNRLCDARCHKYLRWHHGHHDHSDHDVLHDHHCPQHNPEQKERYRGGTLVRGLCCVVVQRIASYYVRRIVIANYFNQQKIPQTVHSQGLQSS